MFSFLNKLFQSVAVRRAFVSLVLACLAALGYAQYGCTHQQSARAAERVTKFYCQAEALRPLVGDVLDAEELVRDLYTGKAGLDGVVQNLGATPNEIVDLIKALNACEPEASLPVGSAS